MPHGYPESDWKVFRELRQVALERFCERVLDGVGAFRSESGQSHHESYLALCRWLGERNREMALAFDDPKRSQMIRQLIAIRAHDLLEEHEFERFTSKTRQRVDDLLRELSR